MPDETVLTAALQTTAESHIVDFKRGLDTSSPGDWLELMKDIVSFANSGGGTILIGLTDEGLPSGEDVSACAAVDPADITNKIHKYSGVHFHSFEIRECEKDGSEICAICVGSSQVPIVFTKVGTYEVAPGKQKNAFSVGTVYFRHGAKSEPGNSDDLRAFLERQIEATRKGWMEGIARVVEAPAGSRIAILPPEDARGGTSEAVPLRLVDDPSAPAYYAVPIDTTHPFRQKEVVQEVNRLLAGRKAINSHHIVCIRRVFNVQKNIAFCYNQNYASPRYSKGFVDWIVSQFDANPRFFEETKTAYDTLQRERA